MGSLGVGLHPNVPMDDYVRDPAPEPSLSAGLMHTLVTRSPAHARIEHPRLNTAWAETNSSRADLGTAIHSAILGGRDLVYAPQEFTDWRKKDAMAFRDEARARGKTALLARQFEGVETAALAAKRIIADLASGPLLYEHTMVWKDGPTWKRARPDLWIPDERTIIDIKTCTSADPESWIRTSLPAGGYDISSEHYLEGIRAVAPGDADGYTEFLFLLVEIEAPFACSLVALDPEYSDLARMKCARATQLWAKCCASGEWPAYDTRTHYASPRPWELDSFYARVTIQEEASK